LRAHSDLRQRGTGRVLLCAGERNLFQIPGATLAVDPQSVSTRMAGSRSDPYVGGPGAGIWRAVREAMLLRRNVVAKRNSERATRVWGVTTLLCSGRNGDTTPPNGNCGAIDWRGLCLCRVTFTGSADWVS